MRIEVIERDEYEEIYEGDADYFLEVNGYDEELEMLLNKLEKMEVGDTMVYYGNQYYEYLITKLQENGLYED